MLANYAREGGLDPVILFHGAGQGNALVSTLHADSAEGQPRGLPSRVIPLQLHHMASTGIDVWLSAIAYGASGISVLVTDEEAPQYADALEDQMGMAQEILTALGYAGVHFQLVRAATAAELGEALAAAPAGVAPPQAATFHLAPGKAQRARHGARPFVPARHAQAGARAAAARFAVRRHRSSTRRAARCACPASAPARRRR